MKMCGGAVWWSSGGDVWWSCVVELCGEAVW